MVFHIFVKVKQKAHPATHPLHLVLEIVSAIHIM